MAIKKYGPTTPGRRGMTVTDYSVLSKVAPERSLLAAHEEAQRPQQHRSYTDFGFKLLFGTAMNKELFRGRPESQVQS